jgi:hypothetical protein
MAHRLSSFPLVYRFVSFSGYLAVRRCFGIPRLLRSRRLPCLAFGATARCSFLLQRNQFHAVRGQRTRYRVTVPGCGFFFDQLEILRPTDPVALHAETARAPRQMIVSCLYPTYVRGEAFLAARQGAQAAAEFQKILDHSGIVWNCWTGALARLGMARANALQARTSQGTAAADARVRTLADYKDFLTLWKNADPDIPILKQAKAEYARLQ